MQQLNNLMASQLSNLHIPTIHWTDIVEIIILTFVAYHILVWIKNTRAWALLKGVVVIAVFILIAAIFKMNTILWIVSNVFSIAAIAMVVVLQPELRKALEELGRKNFVSSILSFDGGKSEDGLFSDRTVNEIVKACVEMGKAKTGALIVIERSQSLYEYERTGIDVDALISSQLLINIFEHNTPLHDGAIIVRGNRVISATCYLPLSDNMALSKDLGTRHRAGVGISEATDSLTVIVSEENGKISVAYEGQLERGLDAERLRTRLTDIQNKPAEEKKRKLWKGRSRNEE
jgi:diadenylate cyclase